MFPSILLQEKEFLPVKLAKEDKREEEKSSQEKTEDTKSSDKPKEEVNSEMVAKAPKLYNLMKAFEKLHIPTHNSTLNKEMEKLYNLQASDKATPLRMQKQLIQVLQTWKKVNAVDQAVLDKKKGGKKEETDKKEDKEKIKKKDTKQNKVASDFINGLIRMAHQNEDMRGDLIPILSKLSSSNTMDSLLIRYAHERPSVRRDILSILDSNLEEIKGRSMLAHEVEDLTFRKLEVAAKRNPQLYELLQPPPSESIESKIVRYAYENPPARIPLLTIIEHTLAEQETFGNRLASIVEHRMINKVIHVAYANSDRRRILLPLIVELLKTRDGFFKYAVKDVDKEWERLEGASIKRIEGESKRSVGRKKTKKSRKNIEKIRARSEGTTYKGKGRPKGRAQTTKPVAEKPKEEKKAPTESPHPMDLGEPKKKKGLFSRAKEMAGATLKGVGGAIGKGIGKVVSRISEAGAVVPRINESYQDYKAREGKAQKPTALERTKAKAQAEGEKASQQAGSAKGTGKLEEQLKGLEEEAKSTQPEKKTKGWWDQRKEKKEEEARRAKEKAEAEHATKLEAERLKREYLPEMMEREQAKLRREEKEREEAEKTKREAEETLRSKLKAQRAEAEAKAEEIKKQREQRVMAGEPAIVEKLKREGPAAEQELSSEELVKAVLEAVLQNLNVAATGKQKSKGAKSKENKKVTKNFVNDLVGQYFKNSLESRSIQDQGGGDGDYSLSDVYVDPSPEGSNAFYDYAEFEKSPYPHSMGEERGLQRQDDRTPDDNYLLGFLDKYGDRSVKNQTTNQKVSYNTLLKYRTLEEAKSADRGYEKPNLWPKANEEAWTWAINEHKQRGFDMEEADVDLKVISEKSEIENKRIMEEGRRKGWSESKIDGKIQKNNIAARDAINKARNKLNKKRDKLIRKREKGSLLSRALGVIFTPKYKDVGYEREKVEAQKAERDRAIAEKQVETGLQKISPEKRMELIEKYLGSSEIDPEAFLRERDRASMEPERRPQRRSMRSASSEVSPVGDLAHSLIHLAYTKPEFRSEIIPFLTQERRIKAHNPEDILNGLIRLAYLKPSLQNKILPAIMKLAHNQEEISSEDNWLANSLVRMAHSNPSLRPQLLSLLMS